MGDWEKSLYVAKNTNLMGPRRILEIGRNGRFGRSGEIVISGRSGKRWRGEHMWSRRIGKLGAWELQEIGGFGRFGRFGRFGGFGRLGRFERFGRLGRIIICGEI